MQTRQSLLFGCLAAACVALVMCGLVGFADGAPPTAPTAPAAGGSRTVRKSFDDKTLQALYTVDKDGRRHGEYIEYHRNGQRKILAWYREGKLDGKYIERDERGSLVRSAGYAEGELHGWQKIYKAGALRGEQAFHHGKLAYPKGLTEIKRTLAGIARAEVPGAGSEAVVGCVRRLMAYRYICDVPYEGMSVDAKMTRQATAAAKVCRMLGRLTHGPKRNPGVSDEQFADAKAGAGHSNLSSGRMRGSVDAFMNDSDSSNIDRVGHRRWCLNPKMLKVGFGQSGRYSAFWCMDRSRSEVPDFDFVAYPARGFMPIGFFPGRRAWSVSLNPRKYKKPDKARVKVSVWPVEGRFSTSNPDRMPPMKLKDFNVDLGGYGIANAIIFRPDGVVVAPGRVYWVRITGLKTAKGADTRIEYPVEFAR